MKKGLFLAWFLGLSAALMSQSLQLSPIPESIQGNIGETVKVPIVLTNTDSKPVIFTIHRSQTQIGTTQKTYICLDPDCQIEHTEDVVIRLDAGERISNLYAVLEGGLVEGYSTVKYTVQSRADLTPQEFTLNFNIEDRPEKSDIYSSQQIAIHDVYPNPASDFAFIDYKILSDNVKAKVAIHNILGNVLGEYELSAYQSTAKIPTENLSPGIYFYTLYIDNEGVMTRKLIIRK